MQQIIIPAAISGTIKAPASKSVMQRACAAALIRKGTTLIHNYGKSMDDRAALDIITRLGARVENINSSDLLIHSGGIPGDILHPLSINCGESGLSVRMFTPIAALFDQPIVISGEGSLRDRPLDFFDQVLPQLGVQVESASGKLPLSIKGPLQPSDIVIDGSISSQFLTGLLFAYCVQPREVSIKCPDLKSRPYISLTLKVMSDFGLPVPENDNWEIFRFKKREIPIAETVARPHSYTIEGDWSGAAFLLVAGAIAGSVKVEGLNLLSEQADKRIVDLLSNCGCTVEQEKDCIKVTSTEKLYPFDFDATHCPDLFPPLVALAAYAEGNSSIKGVSRLFYKESNRALTLQEEFGKLGIKVLLQGDKMVVEGVGKIKGAIVDSHNDHRIAMACAVAALKADGPVVIENAEAVHKSYPDFFHHLRHLQISTIL